LLLLAAVLFGGLSPAVAAPLAVTEVVNTASVSYRDANGNLPSSPLNSNQVSTALNPGPVLEIGITPSSNPVGMGAPLRFEVTYANTGTATAQDTVVEVQLSEHVILISSSGPTPNPGTSSGINNPAPAIGDLLSWNLGDIQPGTSGTITIDTTVKTPADYPAGETPIANGTLINTTATLSSANTASAISSSSAVLVGLAANLTLAKTVDDPTLQIGEAAAYALTYANIGNQAATNVTITDAIPANMTYVTGSASAGAVLSGGQLTWVFPSVGPGETQAVSFTATVDGATPIGTTISNQGFIVSDLIALTPSNLVSSTVVVAPSVTLTVTPEATVVPVGGLIVMTASVTNTGTVPIGNLILQNPLPPGTTFVSADSSAAFGAVGAGGLITWDLGALDPAQTRSVSFILRIDNTVAAGTDIDNFTTLSGAISDTVTAVTTISTVARTDATIIYTDPAGAPVATYGVDASVCISVNDPDLNELHSVAETTVVVLDSSNPTDQETLTLTETGVGTGIFTGCAPSSTSAATPEDGVVSAVSGAVLAVTHVEPSDDNPIVTATIWVDPNGIAFDAITGTPVNNVEITLYDGVDQKVLMPTGYTNPVTTSNDGYYAFPALPTGDYRLSATTSGSYAFPSVTPDSALPPSFTVTDASRGLPFTLATTGALTKPGAPTAAGVLAFDIPLDPVTTVDIFVKKSVNRNAASIGDIIRYTIEVENLSGSAVDAVTLIDTFPAGVHYKTGTSRINGTAAPDPTADGTRSLTWELGTLSTGDVLTIDYICVIGAGANTGTATNRAFAVGTLDSTGTSTQSNIAAASITVSRGIFTDRGTIIGKVFIDRNCNSLQDTDEVGVSDVTLYMEDGTRVVTDENGLYSIPKVKTGTHVLLLDKSTLPDGLCTAPTSGKFMGSSDSQFVDLGFGSLVKANFSVFECAPPETTATIFDELALIDAVDADEAAASGTSDNIASLLSELDLDRAAGSAAAQEQVAQADNAAAAAPTTLSDELALVDADTAAPDTAAATANPAAQKASVTATAPATTAARQPEEDAAATSDGAKEALSIEEQIEEMEPGFTIVSPADGAFIAKEFVTIWIQAHKNTPVVLGVNGDMVPNSRISRTMSAKGKNVVVYEYLNVPLKRGVANNIIAIEKRPTGELGALEEITVNVLGTPDAINVNFAKDEIVADGRATTQVTMTVLDRAGNVVSSDAHITVFATAGTILGEDADLETPDHQIPLAKGVATFTLRAPRDTQTASVVGEFGGVEGSSEIFFAPHLRDMLVVGYGELAITPKGSSGSFESGGRGAFFAKGTVADGVLLTAAYDSDGGDEGLFSPQAEGTETEDDYPTYGDESETAYEAASSDKLYVRLDKGRSHALWGDFNTGLADNELTAYRRALTGAELEGEAAALDLYGFYSYTSRTQAVESQRAKGISGYYYLEKNPVVVGTERIIIETRDRGRTDRVLKRTVAYRGIDYRIDYELGIVMFLRPVPSMDAGFNPVYIVVSYESDASGDRYHLGGGRVGWSPTDWLDVGVTGIYEEQATDDYELVGADATITLPGATTIKAEVASSRASIENNFVLDPKSGAAHLVELTSKPREDFELTAYYRNIDDKFVNDSATSVSRGSVTYGGEAQFKPGDETSLRLEFFVEDDTLNDMESKGVSASAERKFGATTATVELAHNESKDRYIPPSDPDSREPYDISRDTVAEATTLMLAASSPVSDDLSVNASHKQDITSGTDNLTGVGLDYRLSERNRLYLRGEYETREDFETARLVAGVESKVTDNTVAFNESRMTNGQNGLRNVQVAGLRNRMLIGPGLSADFSVEQHLTTSGAQDAGEPDALAATAAVEYVPDEKNRLTGRTEYLKITSYSGRYSFLGEAGAAHKFDDVSLMATLKYFSDQTAVDSSFTQFRLRVGLARRPVASDRFHGLAMVEYRLDDRSGASYSYDTTTYLASLAGNYQVDAKTQLNAKWAGKVAKDLGTSAYTDLYSFGVIRDIRDRWDVGLKYRLLRSEAVDTVEHGGQVEVGYRLEKNIWLTGGYSFDDFDQDLTGESFSHRGPFIKLRIKWPVRDFKVPGQVAETAESTGACIVPAPITVVVKNPPVKFEGPITILAENPPLTVPKAVDVSPLAAIVEFREEPDNISNILFELPPLIAPIVIPPQFADLMPVTPSQPPTMVIDLNILFASNSTVIRKRYLGEIAAAAEMMKKYPATWIIVEGHTDNSGPFPLNMKLSKSRAKSVADLLKSSYGIEGARIKEVGYGYTKNIATNATKEGRAKNRRVYAVFYDKKP
jgi:uncharacterized repeat protein (TIGR01451 family)